MIDNENLEIENVQNENIDIQNLDIEKMYYEEVENNNYYNRNNTITIIIISVIIMVIVLLGYMLNNRNEEVIELDTINGFEPMQFKKETFLIFYVDSDEKLLVEQVDKKGKCLQKYIIDEPYYINANQNYYNSDKIIMSADNDSYVNSNLMYYDTKTGQFVSRDVKVINANNIGKDMLVNINIDRTDPSEINKQSQNIAYLNEWKYRTIKLNEPRTIIQMAKFNNYIVLVTLNDMIFVRENKWNEVIFNLKEKSEELYNGDTSALEIINVSKDNLTFVQSGHKQNVYSINRNFTIEEVMIDERNSEKVKLHTQRGLLINDYTFLYTSHLPRTEGDEFVYEFNVLNLNDKTIKTVENEYIEENLKYTPLYVDYYKDYLYLSELSDKEENLLVVDINTMELVTEIKLNRDRNTSYGRMVVAVEGK